MSPADVILRKALVASSIPSSEWEKIRADLRNRAFFSAQVESVRFLHEARKTAHAAVARLKRADGAGFSEADAIERIRSSARSLARELKNVGAGGILDPSSFQRAKLVLETQASLAAGYVRHLADTQPGALAAFPAKELFRSAYSKPQTPRNWIARWLQAGGKLHAGRMAALVTDPVWAKISRFGSPYPPFDFNSGMETRPLSRDESVRLGIIAQDAPPPQPPQPHSLNDGLQAEVDRSFLDSQEWANLKNSFGDFIQYERTGDKVFVKWRGERLKDVCEGKDVKVILGKSSREATRMLGALSEKAAAKLADGNCSINGQWVREHGSKHIGENEKDSRGIPLDANDYELIPLIWRTPDRILPPDKDYSIEERSIWELDAMQGSFVYRLVVDYKGGARIASFYKAKKPPVK